MSHVKGCVNSAKFVLVHDGVDVIVGTDGYGSVATRETIVTFDTQAALDAEVTSLGLNPLPSE